MMETAIKQRPNVLIFMTDQQNGWTIRDGQKPRAITPHLDQFRQRAVSFTNAYSPSPHCCPSRVSFHTGKYPSEHGVWNNVNVSNALTRGPRVGTPFWSRDFASAGYHMPFSGKWHVSNFEHPAHFGWDELMVTAAGFGEGLSLEEQAEEAKVRELKVFDEKFAEVSGKRGPGEVIRPGWPGYTHYGTDEDPYGDARVVDKAVEHIHKQANQSSLGVPWCMFVGTLGPHDPYTPPERFLDWYDIDEIDLPVSFEDSLDDKPGLYSRTRDRFDQLTREEHREALRHYLAFCSYEDELFGRLLNALERSGQADNTIVMFLSDHGDYAAEHGLWGKGLPAFQSAYRIPLVIGGPGVAEIRHHTECEIPTSVVDLGPTLLGMCGVPSSGTPSGRTVAPWLQGEDLSDPDSDIFFQSNGNEAYGIQRAVISEGWKLVYNMFDHDELYDLTNDPDELVNLLSSPAGQRLLGRGPLDMIPENLRATVEYLYRKLWTFCLEHNDENINDYIVTALASFGPGIVKHGSPDIEQRPSLIGGLSVDKREN